MHYYLVLITTCILLAFWFIDYHDYLRVWITHCQTSIAKRKSKSKSRLCPFPTKRPDCPLCQAEENLPSELIPEPPPLIKHTRGRPRSVDTDMHYCPNPLCRYYGWLARGNICSNGHPNSSIWRQMECIVCKTFFTETQGTVFYCSKVSPDKIIMALKIMSEGVGIHSTSRILNVDANTVENWLEQGAKHMEAVSNYLIHNLRLSQIQVDELWSLLGKRDELTPQERNNRWIWSAIDSESKLWLGFVIGDRSLEAAQVFIHQVSQVLASGCVPLFLSDRWKPYAIALLTHFGHWVHIASEHGRRRLPRWMPLPELRYAQVVKRRVKRRIVHVSQKVIYGRNVRGRIKQTIGSMINTSFVERMNLTLRHHVPALARRTIQIAKTALGLEQQLSLVGGYYNFCLPHTSLRQSLPAPIPTKGNGSPKLWEQRTPAMAAGITDHIWTMEELLKFRAPPWRQPMPERRAA